MDIKQFRQIIREEVVKAMQDELREILVEAVEIASRPESQHVKVEQRVEGKDSRVNHFTPPKVEESSAVKDLSSLLQETALSMKKEDYGNVLGTDTLVQRPDFSSSENLNEAVETVVDPLPDFVSRAAQIFAAANQKDRERHGL